jgi:SsrA-binding protein
MPSQKKKSAPRATEIRNSRALRNYFIDEKFEAGIALRGTEVKSIREGRAQLNESFARYEKGELWLYNMHIDEYRFGNQFNHEPRRKRKLLMHRHQIRKIGMALDAGGRTLIPLRMYFKEALLKVEVALCTGKKLFDKRDDMKRQAELLEAKKILKARNWSA